MKFTGTEAVVHNEGCDLHYYFQGHGPLITFIPGGSGDGAQFFPLMAAISDRFTTATFDRRQMSASQVPVNKRLSPPQQARDVRAVIRALGFNKSIVFGNSSGAIFALQFAHDFPDMVVHVIAHEAPTVNLLPDASAEYDWLHHLMDVYETDGLMAAASEFRARLIGYDDEDLPPVTTPPDLRNVKNFWDNEILMLAGYLPNLWRIVENKTSVGIMRGVRSKDAFFARTTVELAKILGTEVFEVPGHHQGFQAEPEAFTPRFLEVLDCLDKEKGGLDG